MTVAQRAALADQFDKASLEDEMASVDEDLAPVDLSSMEST